MTTHIKKKTAFSLIELLIVISILGALTAIILPQFNVSEQEAQEAISKHNAMGLMRFLNQYESVHGVFPTLFHSGLTDNETGGAAVAAMPSTVSTAISSLIAALPDSDGISSSCEVDGFQDAMRKFGLRAWVYGEVDNFVTKAGSAISSMTCKTATNSITESDSSGANGDLLVSFYNTDLVINGESVTINGKTLDEICSSSSQRIVLAWITPELYSGMALKSDTGDAGAWASGAKVKLEQIPNDPMASEDEWPYYIAVFQVYAATPPNTVKLLTILTSDGENLVNP